jgi:hypothetical protein
MASRMGRKAKDPSEDLARLEERVVERFGAATFPGTALGNKVASLEAQIASLNVELAEQRGRRASEARQETRDIARGVAIRAWLTFGISAVALLVAVLAYLKK